MRSLAALLLVAALAGIEPPTLTRIDPVAPVLVYDLAATAPWMPLLWEHLSLRLPEGSGRCEITVAFQRATNITANANDLLALREGGGVVVSGLTCTVAGITGRWSGVVNGSKTPSTPLTIAIDQPIAAEQLLQLCRQIHYANFCGKTGILRRRLHITVRTEVAGTWFTGVPLVVELDGRDADQPPRLRCDEVIVPLDGESAWRTPSWYDSRPPAAGLRWRLVEIDPALTVEAVADGVRREVTADLVTGGIDFAWFALAQPRLRARDRLGTATCTIEADDGVLAAATSFGVQIVPPQSGLVLVGDLPFAAFVATTVRLQASRTDIAFAGCRSHPASGAITGSVAHPFSATYAGAAVDLSIDPSRMPEATWAEGTAVFTAGEEEFLLPYCIRLREGIAQ